MSMTDDLSEVSSALADDLGVSGDPDDYQDPTPPAPVPEQNYRLRLEVALDKDKDGKPKGLTDENGGFYPTILVIKGEVVEGPAASIGRTAISYERIYTKPYARGEGLANGLSDLTRSFDQTRGFNNFTDGFALLAELAETETMRCRLRWEAFDGDHFTTLADAEGGRDNLSKEQKKAISKVCSVRGAKNFDKNGIVTGPGGTTLSAKARIAQTYPSGEKVNIKS